MSSAINSMPLDMGENDENNDDKAQENVCLKCRRTTKTLHCRVIVILVVFYILVGFIIAPFFNGVFFPRVFSIQSDIVLQNWKHGLTTMASSLEQITNHTIMLADDYFIKDSLISSPVNVDSLSQRLQRVSSSTLTLQRLGFVAIYGSDYSLLSYLHYSCDGDDINGTNHTQNQCSPELKPGAVLPKPFSVDSDESRTLLKMIMENIDSDGFKGSYALPSADGSEIYLYAIHPIISNNNILGYVLGGGDLRLFLPYWAKCADVCYSVWNTQEPAVSEDLDVKLAGMYHLDLSTVDSSIVNQPFNNKLVVLNAWNELDRRVCSVQLFAEKSDPEAGLSDLAAVYSFFSNSLPNKLLRKVDTTLTPEEAKLVNSTIKNGAYIRFDVPERFVLVGRRMASSFGISTIFVVLITVLSLYLYLLFAVLRRLHAFTQALMETLLNAFEALNDTVTFGKTQRRALVEEVMSEKELAKNDGDEIKMVTALAKYLDSLQESRLKQELDVLHEMEEQNRILLDTYRLVNMFVGREEFELKESLPGLVLNSQENLKRSTLRQMMNGALVMKKPVEFKTMKAILSSSIATLVFKNFCRHCGLDAYQSFMFLIDLVWLRSIELGAIEKVEEFASVAAHDDERARMMFDGLDAVDDDTESDSSTSISSRVSSQFLSSTGDSASKRQNAPGTPRNGDDSDDSPTKDSVAARRSFFRGKNLDLSQVRPAGGPLSPLASPSTTYHAISPVHSPPGSPRFKKVSFSKQLAWSPEPAEFQKSLSSLPAVNESIVEKSLSPRFQNSDRVQAMFHTEMGRCFAKTMYQAYFGEKSLAQRYKQKSALLGCGKTKEYYMLRDAPQVVLTPKVLETLAECVTKRLHHDVLSKFQQSFIYKVMVMIVDVEQEIGKKRVDQNGKSVSTSSNSATPSPYAMSFPATPIFRSIWKEIVPSDSL